MRFFLLICFVLSATLTHATSLSRAGALKKLSLHLRGYAPHAQEYKGLNKLKYSEYRELLSKKSKEYLATEEFSLKAQSYLKELYRIRPKGIGITSNQSDDTAIDYLFEEVISKNLSWDQLLLAKNYEFKIYGASDYQITDTMFFSYLFRDTLEDKVKSLGQAMYQGQQGFYGVKIDEEVKLNANKKQAPALAGALTTSRFFSRYPTTYLNQNRGRAAAIFRIFLCDDMKPVITVNEEDKLDFYNLIKGAHTSGSSVVQSAEYIEKKHGEEETCMACHYKLDPAGKTFNGSPSHLNDSPSKGALVYKRENGEMVNIPVSGLGELAAAIVKQPEYASCQVQHMWDWYIGEDIPLSDGKKQKLVQKFDELQRKPKDFIHHLVTSEDFIEPKALQVDDVRYSHVKPLFKRCDSCHSGAGFGAPILSAGFSAKDEFNDFVLESLVHSTNLLELNESPQMPPPKTAGWSLVGKERELLKLWIQTGAKDDNGDKSVTPQLREKLTRKLKPNVDLFKTSLTLGKTGERYMAQNEFFKSVERIFKLEGICRDQYTSKDVADDLGVMNISSGELVLSQPSVAYAKLMQTCVSNVVRFVTSQHIKDILDTHGVSLDFTINDINSKKINQLNHQERLSWIKNLFRVVHNEPAMPWDDDLIQKVDSFMALSGDMTLMDSARIIISTFILDKKFMTY